jgi:hypothetical protein
MSRDVELMFTAHMKCQTFKGDILNGGIAFVVWKALNMGILQRLHLSVEEKSS